MESWRYAAEGKGFLFSDEIDLSIDSFGRSRRLLTGWDGDSVESTEFIDLGFSETPKIRGFGSYEVDIDTSKVELASPSFMIASNSSLESGLNQSNSLLEGLEASSHDSSLIDLKLGRLADGKNKLHSTNSSFKAASQPKRARAVSSRVQTPYCQVYGCHKDLSALKDYHKRHKVCEAHSKTPRVIVNGLEQRFCQQCSRFHLLVEFDESKRSCRKRLAGHNERRRKPQFGGPSSRPNRLLQSYQGTKFLESSIRKKASIIFPNILPGAILYPEKYEHTNFSRPVKLEEKSVYFPDAQLLPKSFLHLHGNEIHSTSGNFPPATEDFSVLNTTPSVHNLAGVSHSSCALSFLSSESPDLSHSMLARPFTSKASGFPDKFVNSFHSPEMNPFKVNHSGPFVESGGFLQDHEANFLNPKYCGSSEDGSTVNLLQLSSHLHRVEQQRNSAQVKHEIEEFSRFLPTFGT